MCDSQPRGHACPGVPRRAQAFPGLPRPPSRLVQPKTQADRETQDCLQSSHFSYSRYWSNQWGSVCHCSSSTNKLSLQRDQIYTHWAETMFKEDDDWHRIAYKRRVFDITLQFSEYFYKKLLIMARKCAVEEAVRKIRDSEKDEESKRTMFGILRYVRERLTCSCEAMVVPYSLEAYSDLRGPHFFRCKQRWLW